MNKSPRTKWRVGESMGTRTLDAHLIHAKLSKEVIERYQDFKNHAYSLSMVASDLYHNRKNDTVLLKIWEKDENKKLLDALRDINIEEDEEETPQSKDDAIIDSVQILAFSFSIELHYIRRTMTKFYTMAHSSLTKSDDERIENSKVLFQKLYDFRLDVYTEIQELDLSNWDKRFKDRSEDEIQKRDLIQDCLILHSQTQFLKLSNTIKELSVKIKHERQWTINQYTGAIVDSMEYMWMSRIRHYGFKKFPVKEFQKEFLLIVDDPGFRSRNLMLDFAKEFYSVGIHNMIGDAISTFLKWSKEDFEQAWKDDWGYDFDDDSEPRIEKKRNALRIALREQILRYDPLLKIAIEDKLKNEFDKPSKINEYTLRAFSRLCEFVEVQLLLTKIVHLSSRARFWKRISKKIEKLKGKRFLSGNVYSLELNKTNSENEEMLREYATNEISGQGWELFALCSWFLENATNIHSKLHLLMLEANLYEGTIHGIEWNEEKETSESDWGEKIVIELMPFEHEDEKVGEISASYLYLTTENKATDLPKRQNIAYQYTMDRNSVTINRNLKDSEFNSLIYERRTNMTDLNTKYGELLREKNESGLEKLAQKIVERFSKDVTLQHGFNKSANGAYPTNFLCENINELPKMHLDLDEILLTQEIKYGNKKYWAVHSDEWGDNFLIDGKGIEPIDFEDVIFTKKSNASKNESTTYQTGGGILSTRFINAGINPQGFEFSGLAPVNLLSSLARLVASLIQYQIRVKDGRTSDSEREYHQKFLDSMHEKVKEVLLKKAKTEQQETILTCQYHLSIIDWLAHWHLKSNQKMPKEDFNTLRNYIVEKFLPKEFKEVDISPRKNVSIRGFELDFGGISHVSSSDKDDDDDDESDGDLPNCPGCGDSNDVKGPDSDGEYWCTYPACDDSNFFSYDDDDDESDGGLPNCPECGDSSDVEGPDSDGNYWCTYPACDDSNFFS